MTQPGITRALTPEEVQSERLVALAERILVVSEAFGRAREIAKAPQTAELMLEREWRALAKQYAAEVADAQD